MAWYNSISTLSPLFVFDADLSPILPSGDATSLVNNYTAKLNGQQIVTENSTKMLKGVGKPFEISPAIPFPDTGCIVALLTPKSDFVLCCEKKGTNPLLAWYKDGPRWVYKVRDKVSGAERFEWINYLISNPSFPQVVAIQWVKSENKIGFFTNGFATDLIDFDRVDYPFNFTPILPSKLSGAIFGCNYDLSADVMAYGVFSGSVSAQELKSIERQLSSAKYQSESFLEQYYTYGGSTTPPAPIPPIACDAWAEYTPTFSMHTPKRRGG